MQARWLLGKFRRPRARQPAPTKSTLRNAWLSVLAPKSALRTRLSDSPATTLAADIRLGTPAGPNRTRPLAVCPATDPRPLQQLPFSLAAAVIAVPLFRWLKLSSILGHVAAGLVIGPWGLKTLLHVYWHPECPILHLVPLLFVIGLELQPPRRPRRRDGCSGWARSPVARRMAPLLGWAPGFMGRPPGALIVGFGLSLRLLVLQASARAGRVEESARSGGFGVLLGDPGLRCCPCWLYYPCWRRS